MNWIYTRIALVLVISMGALRSEDIRAPRAWKSKTGEIYDGRVHSWYDDGKGIAVQTADGKLERVMIIDLSEPDRDFLVRCIAAIDSGLPPGPAGVKKLLPLGENDPVFARLPAIDRMKIPTINRKTYGQKGSDSLPISFCDFLLWWDQELALQIPKRGDLEKKAEWAYDRVAKFCETSNRSGTFHSEKAAGFLTYFEDELEGVATCHFKTDYDLRPKNLARYTVGCNATILSLTTLTGRQYGSLAVALISADPDGRVVFQAWGFRMAGQIVMFEKDDSLTGSGPQAVPATSYEIIIDRDPSVPQWLIDKRFLLDPLKSDCLLIVKPYAFSAKGISSRPPDDPLMAGP